MPWDDSHPGTRASRPHKTRHSHTYLPHFNQQGTTQGIDFFVNIDAQDAQDYQDMRFLHEKQARPTIRSGLADTLNYRTPHSQDQILYIPCIDVNHSLSGSGCP